MSSKGFSQDTSARATIPTSAMNAFIMKPAESTPTRMKLKQCSCDPISTNNQSDHSLFSTTRQPYWKDPGIMVVTETHTISSPGGGWVVDKKKYLENAHGRTERQ
ncbi:hypothetical protein DE146DRAFT_654406 [Phaeosphaeria sp. MPI-PUGE-AT-0046c]|nr:hypothetical protein DE146DRAFT_654406 [Phaeosphaeria sp. MPI-PUGE-AT-0046c]